METRTTRRRLMASATVAASGGLRTAPGGRVAAQATPVTVATPVSGTGCDPYAFLQGRPLFEVTSTDVHDGQQMAEAQRSSITGGKGGDLSPQLAWSGFPTETKSFLVSMYDADASTPSGFWHWAVFDIPASTTELPTGAGKANSTELPSGSVMLPNDARLAQYTGAAPPSGTHRYFIAVLALDTATLANIPHDATPAFLYANAFSHVLGYGLLVPNATAGM